MKTQIWSTLFLFVASFWAPTASAAFSDVYEAELIEDAELEEEVEELGQIEEQITMYYEGESREEVKEETIEKKVVVINLKDVGIRFATGKHLLDLDNQERVRRIGALLRKYPELWKKLRIEGHTDSRSTRDFNLELSKNRIRTVLKLLLGQGVEGQKITTRAYGESQPINRADNPLAWEMNRRVELKLYGIDADSRLAIALRGLFQGNAANIASRLKLRERTLVSQASVRRRLPVIIKENNNFRINLYQAGVHFGFDKDQLRPSLAHKVKIVGKLLRQYRNQWKTLELGGHTDIRGSQSYNMDLSKRRTKTIGRLLLSQGLPRGRLSARAYGPNKPLVNANNEQAWASNRRVEILLTKVRSDSALARDLEALFKRKN